MKKVLCVLALTSSMTLHAIGCFPWSSSKAPVVQESPVVQEPTVSGPIPKASLEIGSALTVTEEGVVFTGNGPNFIAYSHSGKFAAVTNGDSNSLSVYQVSKRTGKFTQIESSPFNTGLGPDCIAFSPDDGYAAVTNGSPLYGAGSYADSSIFIYRVDRKTGNFFHVQTITQANDPSLAFPTSIEYSPDGRFAAVANNGDGVTTGGITIYAISQVTGKFFIPPVQTFLPSGAPNPFALAYSPDGRFSTATLSNSMVSNFQVDPVSGSFLNELPLSTSPGTIPAGLAYSHNGLFAAVVLNGSNSMDTFSVNQTTGQFTPLSTSPVATGSNPVYVAYSRNDKIAAVANSGDGTITLYCVDAMGNFTPRETVDVFCATGEPLGIAFSPCSDFLAVTDFLNDVVEVFKVDESYCP